MPESIAHTSVNGYGLGRGVGGGEGSGMSSRDLGSAKQPSPKSPASPYQLSFIPATTRACTFGFSAPSKRFFSFLYALLFSANS